MKTIAVVMACYNRKELTVKCLEHVYEQSVVTEKKARINGFLMDDGSTDGTAEAVRDRFPAVRVLTGDGSLFWNGGMHAAFAEALRGDYDYYLWLNDDTFLYPAAVSELLAAHDQLRTQGSERSIVIGSTIDPDTQEFSYGGFQQTGTLSPLKLTSVQPNGTLRECTTMCGNCVLIPREVTEVVGNIDPAFGHRWGDTDYGLRTRRRGGTVWIAPDYVGTCRANELAEAWTDDSLSFRNKIKTFHSIKGYRKDDWFRYVRRHGGVLWPLLWAKPYTDILLSSLRRTNQR